MSRRHYLPCLLLAVLFTGSAACAAQTAYDDGAVAVPDGVHVPSWDELSTTQRAELARFELAWDRMPASRRVAILERYSRWQRETPRARQAIREGERNFMKMSPRQRELMRRSIAAVRRLPPAEQRRLRHRWQSLTPNDRSRWLERGGPGIAPPP